MTQVKEAVLLAAGRGRRLASDAPKCMLEVRGKTLLERHIENLHAAGIEQLTIVVGYQAEVIRAFLSGKELPLEVRFVHNERFVHGSIVSLHTASDSLLRGCVYMDADVIYPAALMKRLVTSKHACCELLDARSEETGEEMMLGVKNGRVLAIARKVSDKGAWDLIGEAVGFAKVDAAGGRVLQAILEEEVSAGRIDQEYEAAMNIAFTRSQWGFERVDDFAWTEIDFQEDVERATLIAAELDRSS